MRLTVMPPGPRDMAKILTVDDGPAGHQVLAPFLRDAGHLAITAGDDLVRPALAAAFDLRVAAA